jgi:hypothetical protein
MESRVSLSATSVILLMMAATSLLIMLSLNQINYIVHGDLYSFGLQFSYRWAMPYWILSGVIFGLSWTNLTLAIIFTLYIQKKSRKKASASVPIPQAEKADSTAQSDEKEQRRISEFLETLKDKSVSKEEVQIVEPTGGAEKSEAVVETVDVQETRVTPQETEQLGQIVENQEPPVVKKESERNQSVL